jgi:hypothetical protein
VTISFAGAAGDLFNRLGRYAKLLSEVRTYQLAQLQNMINTTEGVVGQLTTEADIQAVMGANYLGVLQGSGQAALAQAQRLAQLTVNRQVFRDNAQYNQTLTQQNVTASMQEIYRQMVAQGESVLALTVAGTAGTFFGTGDGSVVVSVKRPQDGAFQENLFAETLTLVCTQDSYTGGAAEGNEAFLITGQGRQDDLSAFDWPLGSNCRLNVRVCDGNTDNGNGNILTNSGFNDWDGSGDFLSNWDLIAGTVGSTISEETGITYDGGAAVKLTGDGATLQRWRQRFGVSAGTLGELTPLTQYAFNFWCRRDGVAPADGTLQVALTDGAGNILNDAASTPNSTTVSLPGLSTAYTAYNTSFRTPAVLPDEYYLDFQCTGTPLTTGREVYLDKAALAQMDQAYLSGPYLKIFGGSVPFLLNVRGSAAFTNSRGAAGSLDTWQTAWYRMLSPLVSRLELQLPSSSSPSIGDNLITD